MRTLVAALILGGVFGTASATVETTNGDTMLLDLSVEVQTSAEAVIAHLTFDEEPIVSLPLLDRGGGAFGIRTELEPKNYVVVFEIIGDEGAMSGPVALTDLGADLGPAAGTTTTTQADDGGLSRESRQLLWLAVALAAGSLSVLAFWVLGGGRGDKEPVDALEEE
ncbi:MAG: hypothetical protein WCE80_04195 [Acidimicrobiia bacterium]